MPTIPVSNDTRPRLDNMGPQPDPTPEDNWLHRSAKMKCRTCMWYMPKKGNLGRCRRHAPTMSGWPVMFETDWCGDHKLNEEAL